MTDDFRGSIWALIQHFTDLGELTAALDPRFDRVGDAVGAAVSRGVVVTFGYDGSVWGVPGDASVSRLFDLERFVQAGGDPHRRTAPSKTYELGRRALWDGRVAGLFVYKR